MSSIVGFLGIVAYVNAPAAAEIPLAGGSSGRSKRGTAGSAQASFGSQEPVMPDRAKGMRTAIVLVTYNPPVLRVVLPLLLALQGAASAAAPSYLFAYFTGNGEDGLHFAASPDGFTWTAVAGGRSFLAPTVGSRLMRDPSIVRGPDGMFHLVWTTGWWDRGIGLAHSKDLMEWSEQQFLPVMAHEPDAQNCWAPEIFFDEDGGRYLIFWSRRFPDVSPRPIRRTAG